RRQRFARRIVPVPVAGFGTRAPLLQLATAIGKDSLGRRHWLSNAAVRFKGVALTPLIARTPPAAASPVPPLASIVALRRCHRSRICDAGRRQLGWRTPDQEEEGVVNAYILIQTEVGKAAQVAKEVAAIKGVASAEDVTGPYDVIVRAEARNVDELGKLVVARIQAVEGITRTLTCPVVHL